MIGAGPDEAIISHTENRHRFQNSYFRWLHLNNAPSRSNNNYTNNNDNNNVSLLIIIIINGGSVGKKLNNNINIH